MSEHSFTNRLLLTYPKVVHIARFASVIVDHSAFTVLAFTTTIYNIFFLHNIHDIFFIFRELGTIDTLML